MDSEKVIKRDGEYVLHTYNRNPIVLEKGHGLRAAGPEGQQYLDFTSGIGVNSLGYCDLDWAEAVSEQAHKLQHTSNLYYTAPCGKLAKKLCKRTGMSKVFFGNSGAEANEGAIKAARKYSVDHYRKDRTTVITLVNSFHGRTIATLTATGQEVFHNYFGPFNEGFLYAPAGDIEALDELVDRTTCAVMLELIQGEGGVMALDPDYVQAVRKLCDEKDLVLIVDEVQTGVGRTGTFLCCEHYNLKPDIVTLAKGLGGGLPIGAVLLNEKVAGGMGPGNGGQPPELPDGQQPGDGSQPGQDGQQPPQSDGQQPPEKPDGSQAPNTNGQQPPEKPDGDSAQQDRPQPPENGGQAPDGQAPGNQPGQTQDQTQDSQTEPSTQFTLTGDHHAFSGISDSENG
mgnify:CR=1 FL=1